MSESESQPENVGMIKVYFPHHIKKYGYILRLSDGADVYFSKYTNNSEGDDIEPRRGMFAEFRLKNGTRSPEASNILFYEPGEVDPKIRQLIGLQGEFTSRFRWFNSHKGFGYIQDPRSGQNALQGESGLRITDLDIKNYRENIAQGDPIKFWVMQTPADKKPQAVCATLL